MEVSRSRCLWGIGAGPGLRRVREEYASAVPWDFSTEPDFQRKLDWMEEFVRERIWPLETLVEELGFDGLERAIAPLQEEVKAQDLWAAHLDPELGGQGFGQVKLGLMHEILGTCADRAAGLRQRRA